MFISQGFKPHNKLWWYLAGLFTVLLFAFVGQFALMLAIVTKSLYGGIPLPSGHPLAFLGTNYTMFLVLLPYAFALLGLFMAIRLYHAQTLLEITTARKKVDWNRFFFSFGIWTVFIFVTTAIDYYFLRPRDFVINFKPLPFAIFFAITIVMIPIQTSFQEFLFRGYLMQGFAVMTKNKWFPLIATSLAFALMRIDNPAFDKMGYIVMVYYIATGLFLGVIALMDDGLELGLGLQAANNLVGVLLVTSNWSPFQTHSILKDISKPTAGLDLPFQFLIIFPLTLYIFSRKYNWPGWREKLTGKIRVHPIK